ncbi:MAG: hypothetical protein ABFD92_20910 [Planctomycetaceae bacterium]|nr:hypothetical protein [Planctomycetaceae bacterium]
MPKRNTQLFALKDPPAAELDVAGVRYRLVRVFKHDFYAMTSLYETDSPQARYPKIVVKCGRMQPFCGLPLQALGQWQRGHEQAIYKALAGVAGIPAWVGLVGDWGYAIEFVPGLPLDHVEAPPRGYFDRMRQLLDDVHARGVAYGDGNKRSNMLVGPHGEPYLIDYQISFRRRGDLPWPLRTMIDRAADYFMRKDIYHLYKHKRRMCPQELTAEEEELSRWRSGLHALHRRFTKPYRAIRRRFLKTQHQSGRLVSPSAAMEDHHQPEKATWRQD